LYRCLHIEERKRRTPERTREEKEERLMDKEKINLKEIEEIESAQVKQRNSKKNKEIVRERQAERRQNDVNNIKQWCNFYI
jgi:hypothetical protein